MPHLMGRIDIKNPVNKLTGQKNRRIEGKSLIKSDYASSTSPFKRQLHANT